MTTWKDSLQRRDDVRAAFAEGFKAGDGEGATTDERWRTEPEAWEASEARKRLGKPLDDTPFTGKTKTHRPVGKQVGDAASL